MAAPTLETNAAATILRITDGTSGDPVTWDDVWNFGAGGGAGLVPKDGGGTARVDTFMTEIVPGAVYIIHKDIWFGNDSDASYFASEKNEMIYFDDDFCFEVKGNATLRLGDIVSGFGIKGSTWNIGPSSNCDLTNHADATLLSYASELHLRTSKNAVFKLGTHEFINTTFSGRYPDVGNQNLFKLESGTFNIKNSFVSRMAGFQLGVSATIENFQIHNTDGNAFLFLASATLTGASFTGVDNVVAFPPGTHGVLKDLIGTITPQIIIPGNDITQLFTCNIHVTDKDGGDLQNVTVDCEYAHLVEGSNGQTYKCNTDFTATDDEFKPIDGSGDWASKWNLYDAGGGLGGDWNNDSFDYKAGTEEFAQQTTDANGDISEQVVQYKQWTTTSELLEIRIHKFTYAHDDYPDDIIKDVIVDHPLVWRKDMGQSTADIIEAVEAAKVTLANGAHGGVDASLSLKTIAVLNLTGEAITIGALNTCINIVSADGTAVIIDGHETGLLVTGAVSNAVTLRSLEAYGLRIEGETGDISAAEIAAILAKTNNLPADPASVTKQDVINAIVTAVIALLEADKLIDLDTDPNQATLKYQTKGTSDVILKKELIQPDGSPVTSADDRIAKEEDVSL